MVETEHTVNHERGDEPERPGHFTDLQWRVYKILPDEESKAMTREEWACGVYPNLRPDHAKRNLQALLNNLYPRLHEARLGVNIIEPNRKGGLRRYWRPSLNMLNIPVTSMVQPSLPNNQIETQPHLVEVPVYNPRPINPLSGPPVWVGDAFKGIRP